MVNVLITDPLGDECLRLIAAVSPRVKLSDASALVHAEQKGDYSLREQIDSLLAVAEIICGFGLPADVISRAPRLKWVQMLTAGIDSILDKSILGSQVVVTNARGIHGMPVSEFVFHLMLMFAKQAPFCFQLKQAKRWQRFRPALLHSKTLGIVGLGSIGRAVARLAKGFGMRVIAVDVRRAARARHVDLMLPVKLLPRLLTESDFVVLTLPLTAETAGLIGESELRKMKPTAYLINVARGAIVDEKALVRALAEGWIAGAGLDVFVTEPLPPDSRLWQLPNVIFSPHVAGEMADYNLRATEVFCDNLRRYLNGRRLRNVVNKKRGY